ncbi:bacterial low temperature requirement A protein-domain-containing protein [Staphylotrichum tortipilum]|uniref:Bacterial low temperature requirement A protein-domain-containing protein n=1 Tax=Staphylotrichum tortipilum TaxID=2831512 RepID=A0AAN6MDP7_9PEZI|nr:bacterial low temperature requirement A protein-domain-containing protein [Staphylotrichum longicolle]
MSRPPTEFLLPTGTKVLVTNLPSDLPLLRQRYTHDDPPVQIEVVLHGSAEHRAFLRESHTHHAARRAQLRERIGAEVDDELEEVREKLVEVEGHLKRIESQEEEGEVEGLRENFGKFGFHAKLRMIEGEGEEVASSGVSVVSAATAGEVGEVLRLWRRPVIKQYFHRGLLWRSAENTEVMSIELFLDLLYVGIIAINGDHAAEEANGHELLRFVVTFAMSWRIWSDVQQVVSWFKTDDILQRVEILFLIACLLGQTTNMLQAFNEEQDSFTQLVAFYLAARLFTAVSYAITGLLLPLIRGMMVAQVLNTVIGAAFWIASTTISKESHYNPLMATRLILVFIALAIDLFGSAVPVFLFRYGTSHNTPFARWLARQFEFFPAINIEHKVERTNAFISLVFGYSVVGILFHNTGAFPLNAFLGKAVLGLVQAAVFNWIYFEVDGSNIRTHAIRIGVRQSFIWQWSHLLLSMSYILAAAGLSKLVVLTDCGNAPLSSLTASSQHRSAPDLPLGLRLYYCAGLGLALACTGLIALSHSHKDPAAGTCRLPKWARLANRFGVAVVFFCLPAAGDRLNSLGLVAVTTGLSLWALFFEVWAKSCRTVSFFGEGKGAGQGYTARCSKRRLEDAMKDDGEIDVVKLGRSEKTSTAIAA